MDDKLSSQEAVDTAVRLQNKISQAAREGKSYDPTQADKEELVQVLEWIADAAAQRGLKRTDGT